MKILIVEDERLEREAMELLIRRYFPQVAQVLTAESGSLAVQLAVREKPELILMDINLPLMDGITAGQQIREQKVETTIIMVSAYSDYEHLRDAMRNSAFDYLVKPYSPETFKEAVARGLHLYERSVEVYGRAEIVQRIKHYIEEHYSQSMMLKDIAHEVSLDKSYLGRLFRTECGMTVMDYLREVRIQRAKELLGRGMSPAEVAEKTGFGDGAYFSKTFKDATGYTPTQYRKSLFL